MADPVTDLFVLFIVLFLLIVLVLSVTSAVVLIGWMGVKVFWPGRKEKKEDENDEESDWEVENDINDQSAENDTNTIISIVKNIEGTVEVTENKDGVLENNAEKTEEDTSEQCATTNRVTVLQFPVTQTSIDQSERSTSKSSEAGSVEPEPEVELEYGDLLGPPSTPEVEEEKEGEDGEEKTNAEEYEEDDLVFEIPEELRFSRYQYLFRRGDFDSSDEDRGYMSSEDELDRWVRRRPEEYRAAPGQDVRHRLTPIPSAENEDIAEDAKDEIEEEDGDELLPFANDIDDEVVTILAAVSEWKQNGDKKTQPDPNPNSITTEVTEESKSPATTLKESLLDTTYEKEDGTSWKSRSPSPRPDFTSGSRMVAPGDQMASKEMQNKQQDKGKIAQERMPTFLTFAPSEMTKPRSPSASLKPTIQETKASGIERKQSQLNTLSTWIPTQTLSPVAKQAHRKDSNVQTFPTVSEPKSLAQHMFEPESSDEDEDDDFILSYSGRQLSTPTPTPVFDRKSPEVPVNLGNVRSGAGNKLSVDAAVGISNFKGPPSTDIEKIKEEKREKEQHARVSRFKEMLKPAVSVTKEQPEINIIKDETEENCFEKSQEVPRPAAQLKPTPKVPQSIKESTMFSSSNVWRKVDASRPIGEGQLQVDKKGQGHQLTSSARTGEIGRDSSGLSVKKHLGIFEAMSELRPVSSSRPPSPRTKPVGTSKMYRSMPDLVIMWKELETKSGVPKPFPTIAFVPPEWKARKDLDT
ncbi:uncharacterized protein LOC118407242 [Branchiostoma floridae]|nr:uncharacterized protein LOC118407242 [Branchiostoma floridae]